MKIKVYTLNAFIKSEGGGNPAGVVMSADFIADEEMQLIAKKVGFSETAFVLKTDKADFRLRYFTPAGEVPLCGHATVAAFGLLAMKGSISTGKYKLETKAGILNIEILPDKKILMDQNPPEFYQVIDKNEIADSLNISPDLISDNLPVQIVSTGLKDIIVPIRSLNELLEIKPDFDKIREVSRKYEGAGYHVFTTETKFNSTAHCRNFAPLYDISEESATGTASGALACYLFKHNVINEVQASSIIFEQGYSMNRPSEISASLVISNSDIKRVSIGGISGDLKEIQIEILENNMLNPCGVNCADCGYFKKECPGCRVVKGKTFWAVEYYENQICPIYDCSVDKKEYDHCGQCALLPCKTFTDLRDPSMSDEEYEKSLADRLETLRAK